MPVVGMDPHSSMATCLPVTANKSPASTGQINLISSNMIFRIPLPVKENDEVSEVIETEFGFNAIKRTN